MKLKEYLGEGLYLEDRNILLKWGTPLVKLEPFADKIVGENVYRSIQFEDAKIFGDIRLDLPINNHERKKQFLQKRVGVFGLMMR